MVYKRHMCEFMILNPHVFRTSVATEIPDFAILLEIELLSSRFKSLFHGDDFSC